MAADWIKLRMAFGGDYIEAEGTSGFVRDCTLRFIKARTPKAEWGKLRRRLRRWKLLAETGRGEGTK